MNCKHSNQPDLELASARDGYPALASWMGKDPDGEALVFRKFGRLGARNLLHLQSRLIQLEYEIDELDNEARRCSNLESRQASRSWEKLTELAQEGAELERGRLQQAGELSVRIKEYHEALLLGAQIANFSPPSNRILATCQQYVMGVTGKSAPLISGLAKNLFEDEDDMIALRTPAASDPLSKLLQDSWVFQERFRDSFDHTSRYQGRHVAWTVAIISMLCAAGLLAVAIVSLYLVSNPTAKLGMVVAYTIIFALSIALLTNASRAEIYGASAAYAAVLVVFISGNVGGTQSEQCLIQLGNGVFKTVDCPN